MSGKASARVPADRLRWALGHRLLRAGGEGGGQVGKSWQVMASHTQTLTKATRLTPEAAALVLEKLGEGEEPQAISEAHGSLL